MRLEKRIIRKDVFYTILIINYIFLLVGFFYLINFSARSQVHTWLFAFSWEQRKLGDIVNVYDGVHQTPNYTNSGVMFLSVEDITTLKSDKYISEEDFYRDYKIFPQQGDILMTRIGDIGTPNVVESTEKIAFYVSLALLKIKTGDPFFLCNAIQSPSFHNDLLKHSLTTAIPMKINKDEIGKVEIYVSPDLEEQKKIGSFFKNINNLITLHQRKPLINNMTVFSRVRPKISLPNQHLDSQVHE